MATPKTIVLCMGSSCFSRGNNANLEKLRGFIKDNGLETKIRLKGCRCGSACCDGPNFWIDGVKTGGMTGKKFEDFLTSLTKD